MVTEAGAAQDTKEACCALLTNYGEWVLHGLGISGYGNDRLAWFVGVFRGSPGVSRESRYCRQCEAWPLTSFGFVPVGSSFGRCGLCGDTVDVGDLGCGQPLRLVPVARK